MARPRPVPFAKELRNGWKTSSSSSAGMPHPWSCDGEHQVGCRRRRARAARQAAAVRRPASPAGRWCRGSTAPGEARPRRRRTRPAPPGHRRRSRGRRGRRRCCAGAARRPRSTLRTSRRATREPLRTRVGEEQADRLVQPLGLAQHDVHQLRPARSESGSSSRSTWIEPDIDGQRVADLVRDAGRHLADRGQPLLQPRVPLEALEIGDVLEGEQVSARALGKLQGRNRQPDVDGAAAGGADTRVSMRGVRALADAGSAAGSVSRQLQDVADVACRARPSTASAGDRRRRAVEREHAALARPSVTSPETASRSHGR